MAVVVFELLAVVGTPKKLNCISWMRAMPSHYRECIIKGYELNTVLPKKAHGAPSAIEVNR
jgi:hypothetical protein